MIQIILYFLIAAVVAFGLCWATLSMRIIFVDAAEPWLFPAILCSIFWLIAAPIYAAYLAAVWFARRKE